MNKGKTIGVAVALIVMCGLGLTGLVVYGNQSASPDSESLQASDQKQNSSLTKKNLSSSGLANQTGTSGDEIDFDQVFGESGVSSESIRAQGEQNGSSSSAGSSFESDSQQDLSDSNEIHTSLWGNETNKSDTVSSGTSVETPSASKEGLTVREDADSSWGDFK